MKIGFDAKRAVQNNTGLGNYSRRVIEALSGEFPDNKYVLFAPRRRENVRLRTILGRGNVSWVFPRGAARWLPSLWRTFGMSREMRRNGIEVFHGLSNEIPWGLRRTGVRSVVTVHDLIFMRFPEYYKWIDRWIYRLKFRYACRKADRIVAASECTKRDIVRYFGVPEGKIEVVYQGCDPSFSRRATEVEKRELVARYGLPRRFVLSVGSIEARKNGLVIVEALRDLPADVHVVLVGRQTSYQRRIETFAADCGLTSRVHIFNCFPFADLPALYQSAELFVYPSFFEGFGIPVIEALTSGVPVIAATGSCLEEAGGEDSVYVHPSDCRALAAEIAVLLEDKGAAARMSERGKEYVRRFDDEHTCRALMRIYRDLR
ncbi:MAG: glycosyltransferase family 4 protein [Tannerella sp.]|jgi:glycosyltransferase involved in cell wall biosynthesis|nr:glycosyltransferase family 4 protein [Tannerella sp.]